MGASSLVFRSARRGCTKGPVAPSAREDCIARRSDDGFDLGYITYLLVDYEVKVRYRFAMLRILREQSCNDGEDAQGAHEPQGQVASIPCSRPVSPCSCRQAGRPDRRRDARVSCFLPGAYGEVTGARLCRASCFFPVIYRRRSAGRAIPTCANGIARHCTLAHPISRRSKKCRIDRRFLVVRDCSGSHLTVAKGPIYCCPSIVPAAHAPDTYRLRSEWNESQEATYRQSNPSPAAITRGQATNCVGCNRSRAWHPSDGQRRQDIRPGHSLSWRSQPCSSITRHLRRNHLGSRKSQGKGVVGIDRQRHRS